MKSNTNSLFTYVKKLTIPALKTDLFDKIKSNAPIFVIGKIGRTERQIICNCLKQTGNNVVDVIDKNTPKELFNDKDANRDGLPNTEDEVVEIFLQYNLSTTIVLTTDHFLYKGCHLSKLSKNENLSLIILSQDTQLLCEHPENSIDLYKYETVGCLEIAKLSGLSYTDALTVCNRYRDFFGEYNMSMFFLALQGKILNITLDDWYHSGGKEFKFYGKKETFVKHSLQFLPYIDSDELIALLQLTIWLQYPISKSDIIEPFCFSDYPFDKYLTIGYIQLIDPNENQYVFSPLFSLLIWRYAFDLLSSKSDFNCDIDSTQDERDMQITCILESFENYYKYLQSKNNIIDIGEMLLPITRHIQYICSTQSYYIKRSNQCFKKSNDVIKSVIIESLNYWDTTLAESLYNRLYIGFKKSGSHWNTESQFELIVKKTIDLQKICTPKEYIKCLIANDNTFITKAIDDMCNILKSVSKIDDTNKSEFVSSIRAVCSYINAFVEFQCCIVTICMIFDLLGNWLRYLSFCLLQISVKISQNRTFFSSIDYKLLAALYSICKVILSMPLDFDILQLSTDTYNELKDSNTPRALMTLHLTHILITYMNNLSPSRSYQDIKDDIFIKIDSITTTSEYSRLTPPLAFINLIDSVYTNDIVKCASIEDLNRLLNRFIIQV